MSALANSKGAASLAFWRTGCDNVVVRFGEREIDVTLAARAAVQLGRESEALWDRLRASLRIGLFPALFVMPRAGLEPAPPD